MLDSLFDAIFGKLIEQSPTGALLLISFLLTSLVTVIYKFATDQELIKSLKAEMKEIREDIKNFKNDPEKVMELQKKSMQKSMTHMKQTMKPTLITMLPLLIIFSWLRNIYNEITVNFIGIHSWFWVYLISSVVFSITLRKLLKVH
ncbi:DUF106 domain-containing protein [archaeon]|jgi:uncharacterized membrane protein (DUF106 family)|nr:DUF106 domain-containing protein [archaeon]MBT6824018.1 DUF106 domain-containing protein [archaeon]MBT7107251.1 DUF106 domain-containing protein [archaeon]MBT7297172.1 DUF106 domain-containing protein [archaeon]